MIRKKGQWCFGRQGEWPHQEPRHKVTTEQDSKSRRLSQLLAFVAHNFKCLGFPLMVYNTVWIIKIRKTIFLVSWGKKSHFITNTMDFAKAELARENQTWKTESEQKGLQLIEMQQYCHGSLLAVNRCQNDMKSASKKRPCASPSKTSIAKHMHPVHGIGCRKASIAKYTITLSILVKYMRSVNVYECT